MLILALIMLAAAPLVAHIPLAALAGVLLATAIRMVHIRVLRELTQARRSDALVLVITALATIALDLVLAVLLGLVVAGVLALRKVAQSMRVPQLPHDDPQPGVIVFRPEGPLFFAAAHRLQQSLSNVDNVQAVLIRLSGVTAMDATGAIALRDSIGTLNQRGIAVGLSGVRPEHHKTLGALNVLAILGERVYPDATTAVAALQKHQPVTAG